MFHLKILFISLFSLIWKAERQRHTERKYPFSGSPFHCHTGRLGQSPEPETDHLHEWQGYNYQSVTCCLPEWALAGQWIRSLAVGTQGTLTWDAVFPNGIFKVVPNAFLGHMFLTCHSNKIGKFLLITNFYSFYNHIWYTLSNGYHYEHCINDTDVVYLWIYALYIWFLKELTNHFLLFSNCSFFQTIHKQLLYTLAEE